jgi:hypothetical protein
MASSLLPHERELLVGTPGFDVDEDVTETERRRSQAARDSEVSTKRFGEFLVASMASGRTSTGGESVYADDLEALRAEAVTGFAATQSSVSLSTDAGSGAVAGSMTVSGLKTSAETSASEAEEAAAAAARVQMFASALGTIVSSPAVFEHEWEREVAREALGTRKTDSSENAARKRLSSTRAAADPSSEDEDMTETR